MNFMQKLKTLGKVDKEASEIAVQLELHLDKIESKDVIKEIEAELENRDKITQMFLSQLSENTRQIEKKLKQLRSLNEQ
jgi:predicted ribosome quality control (RQC) complex YloA/Tae2 family protein